MEEQLKKKIKLQIEIINGYKQEYQEVFDNQLELLKLFLDMLERRTSLQKDNPINYGRVALAVDKLLKFRGEPPYDMDGNFVKGDGIFYKSIKNDFTEAEIKEAERILDRRDNK